VLLLCNKDQECNNPLAGFAICLCRQRNELRTCAKRFGGIAVTTFSQARNQEGQSPPTKFFSPPWTNVLDSLKNVGPSQKTLRPTWCPKLVTTCFALMGLALIHPALPACPVAYVQKSDFDLVNILCVVIVVKKCRLLQFLQQLGSLILFCTA